MQDIFRSGQTKQGKLLELKSGTGKKIIVFLLIPGIGTVLLIAAYFSGIEWLQAIVAPPGNREYGLVENLQLVCLLGIVASAVVGLRRNEGRTERIILLFILAGSLFMFLEELDYGLFYYRLLTGNPIDERIASEFINVHNIGEASPKFKLAGDLTLVVLFILFPLLYSRSRNKLLRYLAPDRWFILTIILMFVLSRLAHYLEDTGAGTIGSLHGKISEFRELFTYYVFFIYFFELIFRRSLPRSRTDTEPRRG